MEIIISCVWSLFFTSFATISLGVGLSPQAVSQTFLAIKGKDLSVLLSPFIWLNLKDISLEVFNDSFVPKGVFS